MIGKLVNVLVDAGLEMTHDQIADAVWLAQYLPKPKNADGAAMPLPAGGANATLATPPTQPGTQEFVPSSAKPAPSTITTDPGPAPGELFVPQPGISETGKMSAVPVRVPATEALPNKRGINAALRPLKRRFASARTKILDVDATVEQIANGGPAVAIMVPAPERWLEVALIIDESASMRVWSETINEFALLLTRHGSFRDVRPWYINLDAASVKLYSEAGLPNSPRRLRHPKELIDPSSRRLILVVSDCVSQGWRNGAMFRVIREWGRRGPLTLVQVLPERLWSVTALGDSTTRMRAYSAGATAFALQLQKPEFNYEVASEQAPAVTVPMPMPVINLEGWSMTPWARLIANLGDATADGVPVPASQPATGDALVPEQSAAAPAPEPTAAARFKRFRSAASPAAKKLAGYLAAAPLCLPVMRLVQKAMMPSVRQVDLAEVLLGGLLRQLTPPEEAGRPEDVFYEFFPGVRELLQNSVSQADQVRVLRGVSRLIERQTGTTIDFAALLAGDSAGLAPQTLFPMGQKFAEIATNLVSRLGWTTQGTVDPPAPDPPQQTEVDIGPPYRVYVSFSTKDDRLAREFISRFRALDSEGWTSTWSQLELQAGVDFQRTAGEQLAKANVFVALLSADYLASNWTRFEMMAAIRGKSKVILPVFLEPVNLQGNELFTYQLNSASPPISASKDESEAIDSTVYRLRDILIETLMPKVRDKARTALVSVDAPGSRSCGFFVSPWGHILALAQATTSSPITIKLPSGQELLAERVANDTDSKFTLLKIPSTPTPAPGGLTLSGVTLTTPPWQTPSLAAWMLSPTSFETRISHITGVISDLLVMEIKGPTPLGIAGGPVLDRHGGVQAILFMRDSDGKHECLPASRARQFATSALQAEHPPAYDLRVLSLRGLLGNQEIVRETEVNVQPGSGQAAAAGYHWQQVSVQTISCQAERSLAETGFVTNFQATASGISIGDRLKVDRVQVVAHTLEVADTRGWDTQIDTIVFEKVTLDGYDVEITVSVPSVSPFTSTIASISTAHPTVTHLPSALVVRGFGRIEFMPWETSGRRLSMCGLRVRLDDASSTVIEFASVTISGKAEEAVGPNTAGREGLLLWLSNLDSPRRRPALRIEGQEGAGQTSTVAILSSIASRSKRDGIVAIDVADESYRDRCVEKILEEIAKQRDLSQPPARAQLDASRYVHLAAEWLVRSLESIAIRVIIFIDHLDAHRASVELRDFVSRLIELGARAPNFALVLSGYHSADIPENMSRYVDVERLEVPSDAESVISGRQGILVVGTGSYELPKPVELAAQAVGAAIAAAGYNLITGGWPGVDHVVARAFTNARGPNDLSKTDRLVQVIDGTQEPDFKGGSIVRVSRGQSTVESLKRADLVILIGGAGGTWQAFCAALAAKKLVLALMNTGSDARQAAILLECLGQTVPSELLRADFASPSDSELAQRLLQAALGTMDPKAESRAVDNSDLLWMVNQILPLANEYLRKKNNFDQVATNIRQEFSSHKLPDSQRLKLITALIEDASPAWRITGYLAIEAWPAEQHIPLLLGSLDNDLRQGLERIETRPLWRWLSAVWRLRSSYPAEVSASLTPALENLARTLQGRLDVDPGGECKRLLASLLSPATHAKDVPQSGREKKSAPPKKLQPKKRK